MTSGIVDILEQRMNEAAGAEAARTKEAQAALLEKTRQPFEVWEEKGLNNALAALGGLALLGLGVALVAGLVETPPDFPSLPWFSLGLGAAGLILGVRGLLQRGPILRFTETALESSSYEPIPWDHVQDYELRDRGKVTLVVSLAPGFTLRRTRLPTLIHYNPGPGRVAIQCACPRDWTWDTVLERLDEYLTASRIRQETQA